MTTFTPLYVVVVLVVCFSLYILGDIIDKE